MTKPKIIVERKEVIFCYNPQHKLLEHKWKPIDFLPDNEVMKLIQLGSALREKYQPKYYLINSIERAFGFNPLLQMQIVEFFKKKIEQTSVEKYAIVNPKEPTAKTASLQLERDLNDNINNILIKLFDLEKQALSWLLA